jgi:hypothetical protein
MTKPLLAVLALALLLMPGCATGTHIVTGKQRAPITPDQVTLYQEAPANFEIIGIVNATSEGHNQAHMDAAVKALKEQAAKIGANGVFLGPANGGATAGSVGVSSRGTVFAGISGQPIQLSGQAIYVPSK